MNFLNQQFSISVINKTFNSIRDVLQKHCQFLTCRCLNWETGFCFVRFELQKQYTYISNYISIEKADVPATNCQKAAREQDDVRLVSAYSLCNLHLCVFILPRHRSCPCLMQAFLPAGNEPSASSSASFICHRLGPALLWLTFHACCCLFEVLGIQTAKQNGSCSFWSIVTATHSEHTAEQSRTMRYSVTYRQAQTTFPSSTLMTFMFQEIVRTMQQ